MSVTFTFGQFIEVDGRAVMHHGTSHDHRTPHDGCEDFDFYRYCDHVEAAVEACGCERFDVNLSNANAAAVLERLGVPAEDELVGGMEADEFLGRAMVANVGRDDSGLATVRYAGGAGATIYDVGVRPGYFDSTTSRLIALATEAKARQLYVVWS